MNIELPEAAKKKLNPEQQQFWINSYKKFYEETPDELKAATFAWEQLKEQNEVTTMNSDQVLKIDDDSQLVFGWANVSITKDGETITDHQDHQIDPETLEHAAYLFTLQYRATGEMHLGDCVGKLVESFVATPEKLEKIGLAKDSLPIGWWVGFYIEDAEIFAKIKSGEYKMFSIQGHAVAEEVS